jgi:hypothetical protein
MTFKVMSNFEDQPLAERVYLHVFGPAKIGKTRLILDLVEKHRDVVIMLSTDGGWKMRVAQNRSGFSKRFYVGDAMTLTDIREALKVMRMKANNGVRQLSPRRVWFAFDTITHAQTHLLQEARKINVKHPTAKDHRDEFVRDVTVEVDWGVNLGHMGEIANALVGMPCNVIAVSLEKEQSVNRQKTGAMVPAISGQSFTRFMGDADAILRVVPGESKHERMLIPYVDGSLTGDRSGLLDDVEEPDLAMIRDKMLALGSLEGDGKNTADPEGTESAAE